MKPKTFKYSYASGKYIKGDIRCYSLYDFLGRFEPDLPRCMVFATLLKTDSRFKYYRVDYCNGFRIVGGMEHGFMK